MLIMSLHSVSNNDGFFPRAHMDVQALFPSIGSLQWLLPTGICHLGHVHPFLCHPFTRAQCRRWHQFTELMPDLHDLGNFPSFFMYFWHRKNCILVVFPPDLVSSSQKGKIPFWLPWFGILGFFFPVCKALSLNICHMQMFLTRASSP